MGHCEHGNEPSGSETDGEFLTIWATVSISITLFHGDNDTRMYPNVSGLAACSENCKWYSSLPLGATVSLFSESV